MGVPNKHAGPPFVPLVRSYYRYLATCPRWRPLNAGYKYRGLIQLVRALNYLLHSLPCLSTLLQAPSSALRHHGSLLPSEAAIAPRRLAGPSRRPRRAPPLRPAPPPAQARRAVLSRHCQVSARPTYCTTQLSSIMPLFGAGKDHGYV
jgi:hypothetical protein